MVKYSHRDFCILAWTRLGLLFSTLTLITNAQGAPCEAPPPGPTLAVRDGFVEFIPASRLQPFLRALPTVADPRVQAILKEPDTMWYDESSMVYLYQDSVESVVGGRANCVGRKVGEANRGTTIGKLMNYFGPDYKFMFPFRTAAGTDNVTNIQTINFWLPPKIDGKVVPVKWWQESARGRWHWVFPIGTVIGEVLFEKSPSDRWYAFEIRVRQRYSDGWNVAVYRPFRNAQEMADAITTRRPDWAQSANLDEVVTHLRDRSKIQPHTWQSTAYGPLFAPVAGALDAIPEVQDADLVGELLTGSPFRSVEGAIWKENGTGLETYAPASEGAFGIVPKGYEMGMVPVNEISCNRCHVQTGRWLADMDIDISLYGEIWGEDRIFTWHLFEPNSHIYNTFDDSDKSRVINPRMVQAKLLKKERVQPGDPLYKPLPVPYGPNPGLR